jgi:pimeloyl-ACP methyl ester carboxylesterase
MKMWRVVSVGLFIGIFGSFASGQKLVSFPLQDGSAQQVQGDLYGKGERGLVLAHGGRFNKESWKKQADVFAKSGFLVLSVRFRGDKVNPDGSPSAEGSGPDNTADVIAAVSYLHRIGAKTFSAVGGSLGGDAVGEASAAMPAGSIDRIVVLGSSGGDSPEKLKGRKLFIVARDDSNGAGPRLPGISEHYERAAQPKKLVVLEGSAHAQFLFDTAGGPRLMKELLEFLLER